MAGKVKLDILKSLHSQGYTDKQLSIYFNVPNQWISIKRRSLNLIENKKSTEIKELSETENQIILGSLLGDGHLRKDTQSIRAGTKGKLVHCEAQKQYLEWKHQELRRLSSIIKEGKNKNRNKTKEFKIFSFQLNTNHCLNYYYNLFYDNNRKKHISIEIIEKLSTLGLAIWFMDDGCKIASGGYNLFTNGFNKEEQEKILPILSSKFGLKLTLHKNFNKEYNKTYYFIYISAQSAKRFENLIEPYIVECMRYKLHKKEFKYKIYEEKNEILTNSLMKSVEEKKLTTNETFI
jgi:recombination protein RecA